MSEWQPIETAPRDGTPVDLWHRVGARIPETWWDETDCCWSCAMDDSDFTHWMPMPSPPAVTYGVSMNQADLFAADKPTRKVLEIAVRWLDDELKRVIDDEQFVVHDNWSSYLIADLRTIRAALGKSVEMTMEPPAERDVEECPYCGAPPTVSAEPK